MALNNQVRIVGHCASAPAMEKNKQSLIAKVAVYAEYWYPDPVSGERITKSDYYQCVFFGKNAVRANKLLMKGSQINLDGTLNNYVELYMGKKFRLSQIYVDAFAITTKATMTKEVYKMVFPEQVSPYQIVIKRRASSFDVEICAKLNDLETELSRDQIQRSAIYFELQVRSGANNLLTSVMPAIKVGRDQKYASHTKQTASLRLFYSKNIPLNETFNLSQLNIKSGVFIDEKRYFELVFPFNDCVLNEEVTHV